LGLRSTGLLSSRKSAILRKKVFDSIQLCTKTVLGLGTFPHDRQMAMLRGTNIQVVDFIGYFFTAAFMCKPVKPLIHKGSQPPNTIYQQSYPQKPGTV
jgi:hypothetical protein